jgi:3-hydroxyisobutyrate dehydrogenase
LKIGFIGLGTMGGEMCGHLLKAGLGVSVWAREKDKLNALFDHGAAWRDNPAKLAIDSDIIFLCLNDDCSVEEVVFGENGIAETQGQKKLLVDHSTIGPLSTQQLSKKLAAKSGFGWIDAPVSGGPDGAKRGELIIMAGGEAGDIETVSPFVCHYAKQITHMGPSGSGQAAKACNQLIIGAEICAIAEALNLAKNFGMNAHALPDALRGGWADSPILQDHGRRMARADYSDPADALMMMKDMDIASELGLKTNSPLPIADLVTELYRRAIAEGNVDGGQIAPIRLYTNKPL